MNWYLIFYLFALASKISFTFKTLAIIFSLIAGLCFLIWIISGLDEDSSGVPVVRKMFWIFAPLAFFAWSVWAFIPDRNDMLLIIAGGSVGEFIAGDENAKEIPHDVTRFLRKEILEATMESGNEALKDAIGIESEADKLKKLSKEELIKLLEKPDP